MHAQRAVRPSFELAARLSDLRYWCSLYAKHRRNKPCHAAKSRRKLNHRSRAKFPLRLELLRCPAKALREILALTVQVSRTLSSHETQIPLAAEPLYDFGIDGRTLHIHWLRLFVLASCGLALLNRPLMKEKITHAKVVDVS